jgi:ArsR family transcriptional regulator
MNNHSNEKRGKAMSNDFCSCTIIHEDIVNEVKKTIPKEETLIDLAEFFKVFGDSTRVRIMSALEKSEMCVCDISAALDMSTSAISHQLRILRSSKLVKNRKDGKIVYYSLDDEHVNTILLQGLEHINE